MGRFSAGGVRLHELRQPKPANATFRQGQPPQSHSFSLGLGQPQRAIRSSCRKKPTLGVIARLPCLSAAGSRSRLGGSRPARGGQGERSPPPPPWDPTGHLPAQAPRDCCENRGPAPADRGDHAARRGRTCPKGLENGLGTGSCADTNAPSAIAAPEAPQERRRRCTRTSRRRRRSGWTG